MQETKKAEKIGVIGETKQMNNQQEIKTFFDFERQKHTDFFLPFYQEKNWQVVEDNIDSGHKNDWDVKLEIFAGEFKTVDEKARNKDYCDCLIEIIQDFSDGKLGWYFGKKDWILYGSWDKPEEIYPSSLYLISSARLKKYIENIDGNIKTCISKRGWGITWNITLDWADLIEKKVAKKLI